MAGELWRSTFQIGKEETAGSDVAATRKMYFNTDESRLSGVREPRVHRFATGTRGNARAYTQGPQVAGGTVVLPLSASEIIELLLIGIKGGVTPTGAGAAKLWTFAPDETALESATVEWNDGARGLQLAGTRVSTLRIAGSANGPNTLTAELFGTDVAVEALTEDLPDRLPDFVEGWESKCYIDAHGGTPGGTAKSDLLINWDVTFNNNLGRKKWANNTSYYDAVVVGEIGVEATLTIEAAAAQAATEYANWIAETLRLVRLEFGQNDVIDGSDKRFVTVDIPGAWSAFDLGQVDEGTRAYQLSLSGIYDVSNDFGLQVRCQNARAAAWDDGS